MDKNEWERAESSLKLQEYLAVKMQEFYGISSSEGDVQYQIKEIMSALTSLLAKIIVDAVEPEHRKDMLTSLFKVMQKMVEFRLEDEFEDE